MSKWGELTTSASNKSILMAVGIGWSTMEQYPFCMVATACVVTSMSDFDVMQTAASSLWPPL
jgi:hypothetical protein